MAVTVAKVENKLRLQKSSWKWHVPPGGLGEARLPTYPRQIAGLKLTMSLRASHPCAPSPPAALLRNAFLVIRDSSPPLPDPTPVRIHTLGTPLSANTY